jgi:hypothetical protein
VRLFNALTVVDTWARRITGVLFVLIGIYLTLTHWFGIQLIG